MSKRKNATKRNKTNEEKFIQRKEEARKMRDPLEIAGEVERRIRNSSEIIKEYQNMVSKGELQFSDDTVLSSFDLEVFITAWAEEFDMKHQKTDWTEKYYISEISEFARQKLLSLYGDNKHPVMPDSFMVSIHLEEEENLSNELKNKLSDNKEKISREYSAMVLKEEIPDAAHLPGGESTLRADIDAWASEFEFIHQDTDWRTCDYDREIRKFARRKLYQYVTERSGSSQKPEDFSNQEGLSQDYVVKLMDNVMEIMDTYHQMLVSGEIMISDENEVSFETLKEAVTNWAIQFEREHSGEEWNELDYLETIGKFARQRLYSFLREDKIFYTDEWSTEDIFNVAEDMEVFLSPEELEEIIRLAKESFEDKTYQMEMIAEIIEKVTKNQE